MNWFMALLSGVSPGPVASPPGSLVAEPSARRGHHAPSGAAVLRIVTVGVYGFTLETFLAALDGVCVDCVFDVRQRRGVRGAAYDADRLARERAARVTHLRPPVTRS
jgi:hypothetical protein